MKKTPIQTIIDAVKAAELRNITITMKGFLTILENTLADERNEICKALEEGIKYGSSPTGNNFDYPASRYFSYNYMPYPEEVEKPQVDESQYVRCLDMFDKELKAGDMVDVQNIGVHPIYTKKDGQLYFKPYGKEERVSYYFSNDLIKVEK
jgi:hypothetical protein